MNFTCTGTVTHWKAAGVIDTEGNNNNVLSIWRERSGEPGTYDRMHRGIELGICGSGVEASLVMSNIYECTLPQSERVSVQPGDVVGIELPRRNQAGFRLHFNAGGPINYEFDGLVSPAILSQAQGSMVRDQPQISLTVEAITTTQPLITTQSLFTTQPPTSMEATSTVATESPMATIGTGSTNTTDAPTSSTMQISSIPGPTKTEEVVTNPPTTMSGTTAVEMSITTEVSNGTIASATELDTTTSTFTSSMNKAMEQQRNNNVETIAGATVGGIIAVLLVLIAILLFVLILRRQNRSRQKFTPSNNATIVNPVYNGKSIVP